MKETYMNAVGIVENPIYSFPCALASSGGRGLAYGEIPMVNIVVDRLPAGLDAIIAGSDFQAVGLSPHRGKPIGLVIAEELKVLSDCGAIPPRENTGVVLAGDLYCDPSCRKRGVSGDVQEIWGTFDHDFMWVAGVAGNHDLFYGESEIPGSMTADGSPAVLDGDVCRRNGILIGGVSGIVGNPRKSWRKSRDDLIRKIGDLIDRRVDILVLHEGPSIPEIGAWGNEDVRKALDAARRQITAISGHTHWERPFYRIGENVQAINVDFRVVIVTEKKIDPL